MEKVKRAKSVKQSSTFYTDHTEEKSKEDTQFTKSFHNSKKVSKTDIFSRHSIISITTMDYDSDNNCNLEQYLPEKTRDKKLTKCKSMTNLYRKQEFKLKDTSEYEEITPSNSPIPRPRSKFKNSTLESENVDTDDQRIYERIEFLRKVGTGDEARYEMKDLGETVLSWRSTDDDDEPDDRNKNRWKDQGKREAVKDTPPKIITRKSTLKRSPLTTQWSREPVEDEVTSHNVEDDRISRKVQFSVSVDDTKLTRSATLQHKKRSLPFMKELNRELSGNSKTKPATLPRPFKFGNSKPAKDQELQTPDTRKQSEMSIISRVIAELIDTERNCLKKMAHVIENYIKYFRRISLSAQIQHVFGNIEELHYALKEMYADLEKCSTADEVANVFLTHAEVFDQYTEYLRNKPLSYQLASKTFAKCIQERQSEINDSIPLEAYLLDPAQRPGRYKLLLEKLQKELLKINESSSSLDEAITFVGEKISEANTLLAMDCIDQCPIDLLDKGAFIRKDMFNPKQESTMVVFLFEECVVFCEAVKGKFDKYKYLNCIDMDNLSLRYHPSTNAFELRCFDKSKSKKFNKEFEFTLKASQESTQKEWVTEIRRLLWKQLQYCKDQQAILLAIEESSETQEDEYELIDPSTFSGVQIHDDEEYYSIQNLTYHDGGKMKGPFFDKDFYPRIEVLTEDVQTAPVDGEFSLGEAKITQEFITSENEHLKTIELCMDVGSEDISCYRSQLIENIECIYNASKKLYSILLQCKSRDDLARAFIENENLFDFCTTFIRNRCSYIHVNTELKKRLYQDKSTTSDVQKNWNECITKLCDRPAKYKEFLERLQMLNVEEPSKLVKVAIKLISAKIKETITAMNIDCIHRCPIDLHTMGNFWKKGAATLKNNSKCELFLFERLIVFCVKDEHYHETYLYFDSIGMDALSVQYAHDPLELQFVCCHQTSGGKEVKYKYDFVFPTQAFKQKWLEEIYSCMRVFAKTRRENKTNRF